MPKVESGDAVNRVTTVGARMKAVGNHPGTSYFIQVTETDAQDVCAFAGGYVFVTLGLVEAT